MGKIKFKILNMNLDIDKKVLLTYFYKKLDTTITKEELLSMSCISYDSKKENISSHTKRFQNKLEPYKNKKIMSKDVDNTLQEVLSDCFRIQEELVRCDLENDTGVDYFYIAVIGVDFFLTQTEFRK